MTIATGLQGGEFILVGEYCGTKRVGEAHEDFNLKKKTDIELSPAFWIPIKEAEKKTTPKGYVVAWRHTVDGSEIPRPTTWDI